MPTAEKTAEAPLRMRAYYYGFDPTGSRAIDEVLSAVAVAGKSYHHTEDWNNAKPDQKSCVDNIQDAAARAAAELARLKASNEELLAALIRMEEADRAFVAGETYNFSDAILQARAAIAKARS